MDTGAFLNALLAYVVIIDPLGVSLIFNALTADQSASYCRRMAVRAVGLSLVIVAGFGFFGGALLTQLGIAIESFRIAGGLLLFYTAFVMVTQPEASAEDSQRTSAKDISVFPLSFPLMAGPGCLALTILLFAKARQTDGGLVAVSLAFVVAFAATLTALFLSRRIANAIGRTANAVMKRLLGVLLAALAVQFIADGVRGLIAQGL